MGSPSAGHSLAGDMVDLDYLVIGHVTKDLGHSSFTIGGTAAYAARTARMLGCRVGVITSASVDLDLSHSLHEALVARVPAAATTTFENVYTTDQRKQIIHARAETLTPAMVPPNWRAQIVHLGPVAQECAPSLIGAFGDAFVGVTPQGWMRQWDQDGSVRRCRWEEAEWVLARADAVVLSEEDVGSDRALVAKYAAQTQLLVLTQGAAGCTVYADGRRRHFPAPKLETIDPIGAGDIFAAAFFIALKRGYAPEAAARFANCIAARSVTRFGLRGTPRPEEVDYCEEALKDEAEDVHHLRTG